MNADPMVGRILGNRYEVLEKIGEGGMAVVYRGRDTVLGRQIAVKILRGQFAADGEFVARFRLEAQSAASLSHPNVVNIYDVGEDAGVHYIVMEYVEGETLKEQVRGGEPLSVRRAVAIAIEIARALEAAQRRRLVHRDIKPHNILITPEGSVKVTDFGIARAASASSLTETGTVIGSVHYFSPEQARGDQVDTASDIYSLGVLLYELLTGRLPFTGENPVAVALKHVQEQPLPVREVNPQVPAALEDIVHRMMVKDKEARYRQASELLKDLRRIVPHLPPDDSDGSAAGHDEATQVIPAVGTFEDGPKEEDTLVRRVQGEEESMPTTGKSAKTKKKRGRRLAILAIIVLSFAGGLFWAAQKLPEIIFPEVVRVPDVTGLDVAQARARLREVGLRLDEDIREEYSREVEASRIIRQEPKGDERVRMGREIQVVVSLGVRFVEVPDVIGKPKIEAQLDITQQGLTLGDVTEDYNPNVPPNTVIGQEPPGGTRLEEGRAVNIVVARGSQPNSTVVVPDLTGMTTEEARSRIESLGLVVGDLLAEPNPAYREGVVFDQSPQPGEEVEVGMPVMMAYAVSRSPVESQESDRQPRQEEPYWEETITIAVPDGPAQEVVIAVMDDWATREVLRETHEGGSRFSHTVKLKGDEARIWVWIDGVPFMDETIQRRGGNR